MVVLQPPSPQPGPRGQLAGSRPGSSATASGRSTAPAPSSHPAGDAPQYDFDVAVTFAGTERELAEQLATLARDAGLRVFYDDFYPEQLWGKNLPEFFDDIYRKRSKYCLMLMSPEYAERMWTTHERRSAQSRALQEKGSEYILPIEVVKTDLPGMPPTVGYLPLAKYSPEQIVRLLVKKVKG